MDSGLVAILGTITGAIITGPVTYYFSGKLFEKQKFESAASKFRSTIISETMIDSTEFGGGNLEAHSQYIINSYNRIQNAAIEFSYFIDEEDRKTFLEKTTNLHQTITSNKDANQNVFSYQEKAFSLMKYTRKRRVKLNKEMIRLYITSIKKIVKRHI